MKWFYIIILFFLPILVNAQTDTSDWQNVQITTCLENEQVHKYMTEVNYPSSYINYYYAGYSRIKNYCDVVTDYRKDQPMPVVVPLPVEAEEGLMLVYSDSIDVEKRDTISITAGSTEIEVWNLKPSHTYYYSIGNNSEETLTKGTIHTTGQLRHIRIDSGFNVRDIGGYMTKSGKRLVHGKIYRGSEMSMGKIVEMTPEDIRKLHDLGIRANIDFRLPSQIKNNQLLEESPLGSDVEYLPLPMKDNDSLLLKYQDYYRSAFELIHKTLKEGNALYLNCSFGSDRTGIMAALIETVCGVSLSDIYKDYELNSMANDYTIHDLHRYYYVINTRITKRLNIKSESSFASTVRSYLTEQCGISEEMLDEIVQMMLTDGKDDTAGIEAVSTTNVDTPACYTLSGMRTSSDTKGIIITRDGRGRVVKVMR